MRWLCALLLAAQGVCVAQTARAFSDLERFAQPAAQGGGGGRYFTGAPVDGHSCVVCHEGGPTPLVRVQGLPLNGYRPNETYEVEISWAETDTPYALHLEAIDQTGSEAGLIAPVAPGSVDERGRCNGDPRARPATSLVEREGRRVLAVEPCGAKSTRFTLTPSAAENIYLSAGLVRSDKSGRPTGDGSAELRYILTQEGTAKVVTGIACGVRHSGLPSHPRRWLALGLAFVLLVRRSGNRRRRG